MPFSECRVCVGLCAVPASLFDLHRDPGRGSRFTDEAEGWREPRARAQSQLALGHLRVHTHPPRFPRRGRVFISPPSLHLLLLGRGQRRGAQEGKISDSLSPTGRGTQDGQTRAGRTGGVSRLPRVQGGTVVARASHS